ncbi:MAG TPA: DUF1801 domain-containing protein [Thermoflexales bacterium]|nr:DUF1801 domain-containing protein [Anaerolineae bacterium]HQX11111.1 DUF1801 domain-containing protein [Thermoflexales bacterium]HQY23863.1 DUF1801 domain-containing protein [Thermoflexales bacterium]HQZ54362.1 DUF1801 domain-containing protein [Thermoflexales bacterium]HRA52733.1 DUF1801 domain-containing protein [Thermoflexales bacterium]
MPTLKTSLTLPSEPDKVDAWMDALDHPLKPVAQALRTLILRADTTVGEHIKWNHPAFFYTGEMQPFNPKEYKRYLIIFNLHSKDGGVLLVFPHGAGAADPTGLLSGDYADGRRLARFHTLAEVTAAKKPLANIIKSLIRQANH